MHLQSGTITIALSTYPNDSNRYLSQVEENLKVYKKSRNRGFDLCPKDEGVEDGQPSVYFNPAVYHLFGKYDVMHLMFTDNLSITNKVFTPTRLKGEEPSGLIKTQVVSGMIWSKLEDDILIKEEIINGNSDQTGFDFTCLIKCKINNHYLLGNGYRLIEKAFTAIDELLNNNSISYVFIDSFSSSEICLILFSKCLIELNASLQEIRKMDLGMLGIKHDDEIVKSSVSYSIMNGLLDEKSNKFHENSHIWADTQSHFGIRLDKLAKRRKQEKSTRSYDIFEYQWRNKSRLKNDKNDSIQSIIEWEIIPGHERQVITALSNNNIFDCCKTQFIPGKRDYIFEICSSGLIKNHHVYNLLRKETESSSYIFDDIRQHIRRVTTKILFEAPDEARVAKIQEPLPKIINSTKRFNEIFGYNLNEIAEIRTSLKSIKVSSETRTRIVKLFVNYSSAIQNPLISNLFLDLLFFVKFIKESIAMQFQNLSQYYDISYENEVTKSSVNSIHRSLTMFAQYYEHAQRVRLVNNYSFDEISDSVLSHNSYQQLITSMDNYFKVCYSKLGRPKESACIITRTNQSSITTTARTVNFSVYSLYEPGMLFYLTTKEIQNILYANDNEVGIQVLADLNAKYKSLLSEFFRFNRDAKSLPFYESIITIGIEYFITDFYRLRAHFNSRFDVFAFWHISYVYQDARFYNTDGTPNLELISLEIYRLLILAKWVESEEVNSKNVDLIVNSCPQSQWKSIWEECIIRLNDVSSEVIKYKQKWLFSLIQQERTKEYNQSYLCKLLKFSKEDKENPEWNKNVIEISQEIETLRNQISYAEEGKLWVLLRRFSYRYMYLVYTLSNPSSDKERPAIKIPVVVRNKENGTISHIENGDLSYFAFDPSGGPFFHCRKRMKSYSKIRNEVFAFLKEHNFIFKKRLVKYYLKRVFNG